MTTRSTLVTTLTVVTPTESRRWSDVPLRVETTPRGHTDVELKLPSITVSVRLTEGERIALIEALGGTR
jgi:hypothetical protein